MQCQNFLAEIANAATLNPQLNLWTPGTVILVSASWVASDGSVKNSSSVPLLLHGIFFFLSLLDSPNLPYFAQIHGVRRTCPFRQVHWHRVKKGQF